jgi:8-oxo-dGTP diphosphatase
MTGRKIQNNDKEQGISKDRYKLIPRCLIFLKHKDSILLLKGAPDKKIWANKYNGVGGHIEHNEDIKTAARRELLEETGLSTDLELRGILTVDPGNEIGVCLFVFTGYYESGEIKPSREGILQWVEKNELNDLPLVDDVEVILRRIGNMKDSSSPFIAHSFYDSEGKLIVDFYE